MLLSICIPLRNAEEESRLKAEGFLLAIRPGAEGTAHDECLVSADYSDRLYGRRSCHTGKKCRRAWQIIRESAKIQHLQQFWTGRHTEHEKTLQKKI